MEALIRRQSCLLSSALNWNRQRRLRPLNNDLSKQLSPHCVQSTLYNEGPASHNRFAIYSRLYSVHTDFTLLPLARQRMGNITTGQSAFSMHYKESFL